MLETFDQQKLFDNYATALSKAWESYIKLIDLLLGLAGATALVFVASIKVSDWSTLPNRHLIMYVFIFSGLSLICGASWRFASQYFMEYETLGSRTIADLYFLSTGIEPVTTSHLANPFLRRAYKVCFRFFPLPTGIFLLCAWISIFLVFFYSSPILSHVRP